MELFKKKLILGGNFHQICEEIGVFLTIFPNIQRKKITENGESPFQRKLRTLKNANRMNQEELCLWILLIYFYNFILDFFSSKLKKFKI